MGNCSSEHHARLFRTDNFSNDPSAFRVFVKKKNKFIPGWLKINDDEIVFTRGGNNFQFWPLAHLRRYGYTCSGVFFFESGRRCATGEGLHTFQSHQAERIFHMVQSKIKIEEYARGSRAGSVASSNRVNSLVPNPSAASRIYPVQRFSSEGANNEFPTANDSFAASRCAPPPYTVYQDNRRIHQNPSPNCPSVVSSGSAYARTTALSRERPRSVVSNIEHSVIQPMACPPPRPHNPLAANTSSSTLLHHLLQQQQGYALPPHLNSLAASASGSCLMNQSYHSTMDGGSPWASQQHLEGEIVLEHVLAADGRRRLARQNLLYNGVEPVRIAVPPPRPTPATTVNLPNGQTTGLGRKHNYVNVELSNGEQPLISHGSNNGLNVRELHRTDRSRLEFLSSGPGALVFPHSGNVISPVPHSPSTSALQFVHPISAMQHSFHQYYPVHNGQGPTSSFQPPPLMAREAHQQLMSRSVSGALPIPTSRVYAKPLFVDGGVPLLGSNSLERISSSQMLNYALIGEEKTVQPMNGIGSNSTLVASNTTATTSTTIG